MIALHAHQGFGFYSFPTGQPSSTSLSLQDFQLSPSGRILQTLVKAANSLHPGLTPVLYQGTSVLV